MLVFYVPEIGTTGEQLRMLRVSWKEKRTNVSILEEIGIQKRLSTVMLILMLKYLRHFTRAEEVESLFIQSKIEGAKGQRRSPTNEQTLFIKQPNLVSSHGGNCCPTSQIRRETRHSDHDTHTRGDMIQ